MNKLFLLLALICINSATLKTMELTSSSNANHDEPSVNLITEKYLLDYENKNVHPCHHINKGLDDLREQFVTKYGLYGMHKKFNCTNVYDHHVEKSVINPDGSSLYFYSQFSHKVHDKVILKLDTKSKTIIGTIKGHKKSIDDLIMHKDILISGSGYDGTIKLWNPNTHKCLQTIKTGDDITLLATENSDIICSFSLQNIKIWDITSGKCCHKLPEGIPYWHYNKQYIFTNGVLYYATTHCHHHGKLFQRDLRTKSYINYEHIDALCGLTHDPHSPAIFFTGSFKGVKKWDMRKPDKSIQTLYQDKPDTIKIHHNILFVALSAQYKPNKPVSFDKHPGIKIWDINKNHELGILPGPGKAQVNNLTTHDLGLYVANSNSLIQYTSSSYDAAYKALENVSFNIKPTNNPCYSKDIPRNASL